MRKLLSLVALVGLMFAAAPAAQAQYTWMSLQGGGVFPNGDFDDVADNGLGIGAGLGVFINPMVLLKGTASYYSFGEEDDFEGGYAPLEVGTNIYLGYFGNIRPYATLHGGWYVTTGDFDEFDSAFGLGFGPGIDIPLGTPNTSLFIEPSYNIIFNDDDNGFGEDFDFWGLQIGVSFTMLPPNPIQN